MATFLLVPGAFHGAFWYAPLTRRLRQEGHEVHHVTHTGVGERAHLTSAGVNLDTHIEDVVGVLEFEDLSEVVLVGHSSGGMSVTGAADRLPERISALVYLDAFLPRDGDSVWSLSTDAWRDHYINGLADDGHTIAAPPFLTESRVTGQPLACMLQPIRLSGAVDRIRPRHYLYMSGYAGSCFTQFHERLKDDPTWTVHVSPHGHNVMAPEVFDDTLKVVLEAATGRR